MKRYPEISTTYIDGRIHTLDAAAKQLRDVPKNSVALLGIWRIDNRGITYMNNSVYAFSKANPELPVFSLTATAIGYWAIGGYIPPIRRNREKHGRTGLSISGQGEKQCRPHSFVAQQIQI